MSMLLDIQTRAKEMASERPRYDGDFFIDIFRTLSDEERKLVSEEFLFYHDLCYQAKRSAGDLCDWADHLIVEKFES